MSNFISIFNKLISYSTEQHFHSKASERYIEVVMDYGDDGKFEGWIPIEYRRTGLNLTSQDDIEKYLISIYSYLNPKNRDSWFEGEETFWKSEKSNAGETKKVFDALKSGNWVCVNCEISNPNWARRFQDLKEFGYTFATQTPVRCPKCGRKSTYIMCVHIPRNLNTSGNGYETWSPALRKRIISLLKYYDVYEAKIGNNSLLPDHKFSEIRWDDNTKGENPDTMMDEEILDKFQLMTNQRNQQKREVCRKCFQTNKRPSIFGIEFFYEGTSDWDTSIPRKGKEAEKGCIGCPWYDIERWRKELLKKIGK